MSARPVNGELLCKDDRKGEGETHKDRVRDRDETGKLIKESEETEIYN